MGVFCRAATALSWALPMLQSCALTLAAWVRRNVASMPPQDLLHGNPDTSKNSAKERYPQPGNRMHVTPERARALMQTRVKHAAEAFLSRPP